MYALGTVWYGGLYDVIRLLLKAILVGLLQKFYHRCNYYLTVNRVKQMIKVRMASNSTVVGCLRSNEERKLSRHWLAM